MPTTSPSVPSGSGSDGESDVNPPKGDAEAMTNGHSVSTETQNTVSTRIKIVGVNCNLMPKGALSLLTTGDLQDRASDLADLILGKLPRKRGGVFDSEESSGINESKKTSANVSLDNEKGSKPIQNANPPGDVIFLQELYDSDSRQVIFKKFREAGYFICEGPKSGNYPQKPPNGSPSNGFQQRFYKLHSGEAVFVRKELWASSSSAAKGGFVIPGTERSRGGEVKSDEPTSERARSSSTPSPRDLTDDADVNIVNSSTPSSPSTASSSSSSGESGDPSGLTFRILGFKSYAFPDSNVHGCNALESHVPKGVVWLRIGLCDNTNSGSRSSSSGSSSSSSSGGSTRVIQATTTGVIQAKTPPVQAPPPLTPLLFLDAFFTHLQSCPLSYLYWFSPERQRTLQLECIKKIMKQISVERPRKEDKKEDEKEGKRGNKVANKKAEEPEEVEEVEAAATEKSRTEKRRTAVSEKSTESRTDNTDAPEKSRTDAPTPNCGSLLLGDLNICADWWEFTNLKSLLELASTNAHAISNFDEPDGPIGPDDSEKFKSDSKELREDEKLKESESKERKSRKKKYHRKPKEKESAKGFGKAPPEIWNPLVTIGNPKNTCHSPFMWKIGGLLYDHYKSQLDHCLVSKGILEGKGWKIKEGRDEGEEDGGDGENDGSDGENDGESDGEGGGVQAAAELPEESEVSPDQVKIEIPGGNYKEASTHVENMRVFHLSKDGVSLTDHEGISIELVGELRNF